MAALSCSVLNRQALFICTRLKRKVVEALMEKGGKG